MPITYDIDSENGVILIRGSGTISDDEMVDVTQRIREDPALEPGMVSFSDMRGVESKVTAVGMQRVAGLVGRTEEQRGRARSAALVDGPLGFGMGRMFAVLSEETGLEYRVFDDEDAAHAWLAMETATS